MCALALLAAPAAAADNPAVLKAVDDADPAEPAPQKSWPPTALAGVGVRGNAVAGQPSLWYGMTLRAPALSKASLLVEAGMTSTRNATVTPAPCGNCPTGLAYSTADEPYVRAGCW